jgi:Na+/proline symporter
MKTNKTLYGFLAFGPIGLLILGIAIVAIGFLSFGSRNQPEMALLVIGIGFAVLGGLLSFATMIMFIIHMSKNRALEDGMRIGWIVGMVAGFVLATTFATSILAIIYYFMHITPDAPQPVGSQAADVWDSKINS